MTIEAATAVAPARRDSVLLSNTRWNTLAFGVGVVVNFIALPIVIQRIGLPNFGQAGLVLAVLAPFMLVGTVLGQAATRELARRHNDEADAQSGAAVLSTLLSFCLLASGLIWLLLVGVGPLAMRQFFNGAPTDTPWPPIFLVAACGWAAQQFIFILQGSLAAQQNYRLLSRINILTVIVATAITLAGVVTVPTTLGYLGANAAGLAVSLALWLILTRNRLPWSRVRIGLRGEGSRRILHFGGWQSASQVSGAISNQSDRYLLGSFASVIAVGQYAVAARLQEVVHTGILKVAEVLFPHFSATANQPAQVRAHFLMISMWMLNLVGACALTPLIPLSHDLIALWVDGQAAAGGDVLLRTLALAGLAGCSTNVFNFYSLGIGKHSRLALLTILQSLLTIVATIVLIRQFGALAAGGGILLSNLARMLVILPMCRADFMPHLSWRELAMAVCLPVATGALVGFLWQASGLIHASGWLRLLANYILVTGSVLIAVLGVTTLLASGRKVLAEIFAGVRPPRAVKV